MKFPRKIAIGFQEGTCPLKCGKCPAFSPKAKLKKKVTKMPLEKAKKLIDEIALMEVIPSIQPHIFTEPFANRDLREIILYCLDRNIGMSIITNGILLNQDWVDFLIEKLDRSYTLSFSLDAVTQDTYKKVRGEFELKEICDKVQFLIYNRGNKGPRVGVNFTVEEDNFEEVRDFINIWKYKVDAVHINTVINAEKKIPFRFRKEDTNTNIECGNLQEVMTIDTDGEVRVCQSDAFGETSLGNVFEEGILNIWNGDKLSTLRSQQAAGELAVSDFCYGCEMTSMTNYVKEETSDFVINKANYALYYNVKR